MQGRGSAKPVTASLPPLVSSTSTVPVDTAGASAPPTAEVRIDAFLTDEAQRCFDYVFPQAVISRAFIRAVVYAKYGPGVRQPNGTVSLTSGARRPLHHFEEVQLFSDEERIFVTDTYGGSLASNSVTGSEAAVDRETFGEMNRTKNKLLIDAMEMTPTELRQILARASTFIAADSSVHTRDGAELSKRSVSSKTVLQRLQSTGTPEQGMSQRRKGKERDRTASLESLLTHAAVDAVSTSVLCERRRRIDALRCATPTLDALRTDINVTRRQAQNFYNKTSPKAYSIRSYDDPKDVLRSLHRSAWLIVDPDDKNNAAVTLNVRCLRPDFVPDDSKPGWDGYCCIRGSNPKSINSLRDT